MSARIDSGTHLRYVRPGRADFVMIDDSAGVHVCHGCNVAPTADVRAGFRAKWALCRVHSQLRLRSNQLAKRWPTGGRPDVRAMVPADVRAEITEANRVLATMLDRDLAPLGYDV